MGIEQTSCLTKNIGGLDTEITKLNYHRKIYSELRTNPNKMAQKNLNNINNLTSSKYQSIDQINSSSRAYTRTDSSSQSNNNNKITTIQKFIRAFIAKKRFKERIELLTNIIELDNPVNLIKDKLTSSKLLSENKGEQLWKELVSKKKIIPFEDLPFYRKKIKYYRPNKYLLSTQLIYIDKYKNNNLYKGTWTLEKVFHGFGSFYVSGNKYEGFWYFGKLNGECRYFLQNNDYFHGEFVDGQAQGKGKYFHNDGTIYEGEWKNDQPSGWGKESFVDGSVFEGVFENGIKKKGIFKWNDGSYYDGEIKNNLFEGYGIFHWKEGREYKGLWKIGKMWGYGVMKYIDGERYEGNFENGKRGGFGKYIWNKTKYYEGDWKNGKQDGKGYFFYKGKGTHAFWKEGKIMNYCNINTISNSTRISFLNSGSILSVNKSNYSGYNKSYFKIKETHNYKNINYKLNDITKKKTREYNNKNRMNKINENTQIKNKLNIRNKSNANNFNCVKRKINYSYIDKTKICYENYYNKTTTNKNNKSISKISQKMNYSLNSDGNRIKRKMNQIKKLNQTQENSNMKRNSKEKKPNINK